MKFEAILFDLDGTLLNTLDDLADSVNHALTHLGYPERTLDEVRAFVGNGANQLIGRALGNGAPAEAHEACRRLFGAHYAGNMENKTCPYPGVTDLLSDLKRDGVKIGVVSNKPDSAVRPLVQKYFGRLVDVAVGEREKEGVKKKPAPDSVFEVLRLMGVKPGMALYAGDSDVDVLTAKNAGIPCLAVSWGFRPRESLVQAGAERVIDRVEEFIPAMREMEG